MSTAQWANIGDDPGALHALLERLPEHVPVAAIDYLWIFPARRIAIGESIVVVIGAFDEDPERRRVSTAHFTISRNRKGAATVNVHFNEHGSAPVGAVPRIVQGVLRRLGEDTEASPREEQICGESGRWDALVVELGGAPRIEEAGSTTAEDTLTESEPADTGRATEPEDLDQHEQPGAERASPAGADVDDPKHVDPSDPHPSA